MTTSNTPFEDGLDEIFTRHNLNGIGQGGLTSAEAKAALAQLHKAAIVEAKIEALESLIFGLSTIDGQYQIWEDDITDRIEQYKKEGKDNA